MALQVWHIRRMIVFTCRDVRFPKECLHRFLVQAEEFECF